MCFFPLEKTGQTMSSHRQKHAYHEKDVMGCQSGSFYLEANHMHSLCMSTEREEPSPQQTPPNHFIIGFEGQRQEENIIK